MSLEALARIDAASFGTGLSRANARACWAAAIEGARRVDLSRALSGSPPRSVTIIASANVFTAPMEWAWALSSRGVRVILKSARGLTDVGEVLAAALPGVEHRPWRGGDLPAEAAALADSDAAIVFGTAETIAAIRARTSVPVFGFGPRFGIELLDRIDTKLASRVALDHALYDGRGCMSPAAVLVASGLADAGDRLAAAMEVQEHALPRGDVSTLQASEMRTLEMLARVEGRAWTGSAWLVVELPLARFRPRALPRTVILHRAAPAEIASNVAPWRARLGTIALAEPPESDLRAHPELARSLGLTGLPPARLCAAGEMQRPPGDRALHDGVDVLGALWARLPS